jgi:hypothetical protein
MFKLFGDHQGTAEWTRRICECLQKIKYFRFMKVDRFFIAFLLALGLFYLIGTYLIHHDFKESRLYLLTQICVALGTLTVIILSVYGSGISRYFNPPSISLGIIRNDGDIVINPNAQHPIPKTQIFYHLSVLNLNRHYVAKNCTILLKRVRVLSIDRKEILKDEFLIAPYSFKWALTWGLDKDRQKYKDVSYDDVLNFVTLNIEKKRIHPNLVDYWYDFEKYFQRDEYILQLGLQINSLDFKSPHNHNFEIKLNCKWSDDIETVKKSVEIKSVSI